MWIAVATLLIGVGTPWGALPQSSVSMSAVEVDLWPEYDRPNMLVIYKITLAPDVRLPAALNLRIPAVAGGPNAVAEKQLDGRLTSITYDQREQDEWSSVIFTASRPELQIEYYDPGLEKDGADRRFVYIWPADYPVEALSVQVQQPVGAVNLRVDPAAEHTSPTSEGFLYHIVHLQARPAGEPVEIVVEYVKDSDTLSVASMPQAAPAQPTLSPAAIPPAEGGGVPAWVFVVIAAVVVSLGGGIWWRWGRGGGAAAEKVVDGSALGGGKKTPAARNKRAGARRPVPGASAPASDASFCTQCGAPASSGDRFCHACGSALSAS
jgi:hypothetical protein